MSDPTPRDPVCVVGAGPSGLAMARALKRSGIPFEVFDRNPGVGGIWNPDHSGSPVYDSAHFISSRDAPFSTFGGHPFLGTAAVYPSHREVLAYLEAFAAAEGLAPHLRLSTAVDHAEPASVGWRVTAGGDTRNFSALVSASGTLWSPVTPELPGADVFGGVIRHSVTYGNAAELRGKRVLVVGAGNSGVDIACDATRAAASVSLSLRRGYWVTPKFIAGEPSDLFFRRAGALPDWAAPPNVEALLRLLVGAPEAFGLPRPDHAPFASHPIMNSELLGHLGHGRIRPRGPISRLEPGAVVYADGSKEPIDEVLLATGYRTETPYLPDGGLRPRLNLRLFHPTRRDLYGLGYLETNASVFRLVDLGAELIVRHLQAMRAGPFALAHAEAVLDAAASTDLTAGVARIASARHVDYVDARAYAQTLQATLDALAPVPAPATA